MRSSCAAAPLVLSFALFGLARSAAAAALDVKCPVPQVPGLDQSPSERRDYGQCTDKLDAGVKDHSNWCNFNRLGYWPAGPTRMAKRCMKFGRMTVYRGPLYGSNANHKGACDAELVGANETAMVAVSTKYLKTAQHGWAADKGSCGKCMCVHVRGVDDKYNLGVKKRAAKQFLGLSFLAKVGDRCGECDDDHIDVLLDRPLGYAPYDPEVPTENRYAPYANSRPGLRGFSSPAFIQGGDAAPETVGTWVSDWQWVPCEGWSHARCADMMKEVGYQQVFTPQPTPGVDSVTLMKVSKPMPGIPWAEAVPARHVNYPTPTVAPRAMCGGQGDGCKAVLTNDQCADAQWANCPAAHSCVRDSEYYWSCIPADEVSRPAVPPS